MGGNSKSMSYMQTGATGTLPAKRAWVAKYWKYRSIANQGYYQADSRPLEWYVFAADTDIANVVAMRH